MAEWRTGSTQRSVRVAPQRFGKRRACGSLGMIIWAGEFIAILSKFLLFPFDTFVEVTAS